MKSRTPRPKQPTLDPLALRLEEALLLTGMSATRFGYTHFGDSAFVTKTRQGRKFRSNTAARLTAILEQLGV